MASYGMESQRSRREFNVSRPSTGAVVPMTRSRGGPPPPFAQGFR